MAVEAHRQMVVGLDGSPTSQLALNWAIEETRLRHRPLRLVHVLQDPYGGTMMAPVPVSHRGELRSWAEQLLADRRDYAASRLPGQTVSTRLLEGDATGETPQPVHHHGAGGPGAQHHQLPHDASLARRCPDLSGYLSPSSSR